MLVHPVGRLQVRLYKVIALSYEPMHFILVAGIHSHQLEETDMARSKNIENMSFAELTAMQARIERAKVEKQSAERAALKQKMADMAKEAGFDLRELLDGRGRGSRGKVAVKYRDPSNSANTWTGRGRMPRWMTAATKGGKAKKEDFLIA
jgi:DNA-binding protein H-NS